MLEATPSGQRHSRQHVCAPIVLTGNCPARLPFLAAHPPCGRACDPGDFPCPESRQLSNAHGPASAGPGPSASRPLGHPQPRSRSSKSGAGRQMTIASAPYLRARRLHSGTTSSDSRIPRQFRIHRGAGHCLPWRRGRLAAPAESPPRGPSPLGEKRAVAVPRAGTSSGSGRFSAVPPSFVSSRINRQSPRRTSPSSSSSTSMP